MAAIEFIQNRIAGKEKEVAKLEKKMARILAAEATGWEKNPYYYNDYDKRRTERDLNDAREALARYEAQLQAESDKAASRNVKAILDFLEMWKDRVREFYHDSFSRYLDAKKEYDADYARLYNAECKERDWEARKALTKERRELEKKFHSDWNFIQRYTEYRLLPTGEYDLGIEKQRREYYFNDELFERGIKIEAEAKYDGIIERTNEICGTITDATGLRVGEKGDLDGYVIGERGAAHVHTIGAGGYNIQCFHFRVLVHETKGLEAISDCGGVSIITVAER